MRTPTKKIPAALRHGVYSAIAVLPGEDQAAFDKLHRGLIAELAPNGALEDDIVRTIARLTWRKQNLVTLRIAKQAHTHVSNVMDAMLHARFSKQAKIDPEAETLILAADDQAREELGEAYALTEIGEAASFDTLAKELDIEERFGDMIERCLRRLLYLRGLKSMSGGSTSAPARIAGPPKAA